MATEQLVELFSVDDASPSTSRDVRLSKMSQETVTSKWSDSVGSEKWNIEELWDLSQVIQLKVFLCVVSMLYSFFI